jgi:polyhydroxyalkanoate synthase subunit PhaE
MKGFEQGNDWLKFWSENQKSLFQTWVEGKPPPFAFRGEAPPAGDAMKQAAQMSDLMQSSMEQWAAIASEAWAPAGRVDVESMKKIFDPEEWKRAGSHFDMGLERLTEGPAYATLWDLDRKMLGVQKLWMERAQDVEQYWELVQGAWSRALERFMKSVNDSKGEPIKTGRQMLDLWLATANKSLVEMHRSDAFLEAQRKMTRSSTEYRLAEREIAEAFCEMHHIPTRTEMDETQRVMTELRREIRALKRKDPAPGGAPEAVHARAPSPRKRKTPSKKKK